MLTVPYVTAGEFRFAPTFLDTNNLVTAGTQTNQDAVLNTALLTASQWADQHLFGHDGRIGAHTRVENARIRPDRHGRLRYHPEHVPVVSVTSVAVGDDPSGQAVTSDPTVWTEQDGRVLVCYPTGLASPGLDRFQFGRSAVRGEQVVTWTYVAGYPATQLAADATAGATAVQVLDATGVAAGSVLRLWTPGLEEAVTVTAAAGTTLTLSGPLTFTHLAGDSIQALPPTIREAVVCKTICELLRPNAATQQAQQLGLSTTSTAKDPARTSGGVRYHERAEGLLRPFRRVR